MRYVSGVQGDRNVTLNKIGGKSTVRFRRYF